MGKHVIEAGVMQHQQMNQNRRTLLKASAQAFSATALARAAMSDPSPVHAVKEPAVIGYPNKKAVAIE